AEGPTKVALDLELELSAPFSSPAPADYLPALINKIMLCILSTSPWRLPYKCLTFIFNYDNF
ncbi:MAG: hypothetical protein ABFD66_10140, partial [Smithella sp.]